MQETLVANVVGNATGAAFRTGENHGGFNLIGVQGSDVDSLPLKEVL
jgi:hypothetical protein